MKLADLVNLFPEISQFPYKNIEFNDFTRSNQNLSAETVFVAIQGNSWDGHLAVQEALQKSCPFVVAERSECKISDKVLILKDTRSFYAYLSSFFYKEPSKKLFSVGITGTNGKTTTSYIVEHLLKKQNSLSGVIGTIDHHLGEKKWKTHLTSPDAKELQSRLNDFVALGAKSFVMEVSSHAIDQKRVEGIHWDSCIFTNLSQDHLDYHLTMENYFQTKKSLFVDALKLSEKNNKLAVMNLDDEWGRRIITEGKVNTFTFGQKDADLSFEVKELSVSGMKLSLCFKGSCFETSVPLVGIHNAYNAASAILSLYPMGMKPDEGFQLLNDFQGVPGRLESVKNDKGVFVFVDYAHTPDALDRALSFLRQIQGVSKTQSKLLTVFGCGGDRDKEKRPLMGRVAENLSDKVYITSDNPRTEDPKSIIKDIEKGFMNAHFVSIENREEAIRECLAEAKEGDIVLIAGKGHEDYQEVGRERKFFSDQQIVREYFNDQ